MSDNPTQSVIVIAEESLLDVDVAHIRSLSGDSTDFRLLVPTGVDRNVVAEFVEHLAIFDLKEAWEDLTGQNEVAPTSRVPTQPRCSRNPRTRSSAGIVRSPARGSSTT